MRKALVVTIAMLLVAAVCAWAQSDPLLGPHNVGQVGCQACHAPHNALAGPGAYLWARAIPTRVYQTYTTSDNQGGSLSSLPATGTGMVGANGVDVGTLSPNYPGGLATLNSLPQAHTILCLSCHDTTFSGMTTQISAGTANPAGGILPTTDFAIGNNGNLTQDHPVDVVYPTTDPTYWTLNAPIGANGQYTVTFQDTTYQYGHPARLFSTDGTNSYIECGSCHNPHSQMVAVVNYAGTLTPVPTSHFIRGQYRSTTETLAGTLPAGYTSANYETDNANFCMSCHEYPSSGFTGLVH